MKSLKCNLLFIFCSYFLKFWLTNVPEGMTLAWLAWLDWVQYLAAIDSYHSQTASRVSKCVLTGNKSALIRRILIQTFSYANEFGKFITKYLLLKPIFIKFHKFPEKWIFLTSLLHENKNNTETSSKMKSWIYNSLFTLLQKGGKGAK